MLKKNIYTCGKCGKHVVTINIHEGITPAFIKCRFNCIGRMDSSFHRVNQDIKPDYIWYKPLTEEYNALPSFMKSHVDDGGLLIKEAV